MRMHALCPQFIAVILRDAVALLWKNVCIDMTSLLRTQNGSFINQPAVFLYGQLLISPPPAALKLLVLRAECFKHQCAFVLEYAGHLSMQLS